MAIPLLSIQMNVNATAEVSGRRTFSTGPVPIIDHRINKIDFPNTKTRDR